METTVAWDGITVGICYPTGWASGAAFDGESGTSVTSELVMYTTSWCGYCVRLKHFFERERIAFREVNIEHDRDAARFVGSVNRGNHTVPTLQFSDGSILTNPSPAQVLEKVSPSA
jgi:mycoredoxin